MSLRPDKAFSCEKDGLPMIFGKSTVKKVLCLNFIKYISLVLVLVMTLSCVLTACGKESDDLSMDPAGGAGRLNSGTVESETEAPEPLPKNGYTICVDPGHGFDDPGTFNDFLGDLYEKDISLAVALNLKSHLELLGFTVVMTHDGTSFPNTVIDDGNNKFRPEERVSYANSLGNTIDYYISLHCNDYAQDPEVRGTRIYYGDNVDAANQPHDDIAESLAAKLTEDFPDAKEPFIDKGNFYVIKYTHIPSSLIEMGFVTNADDAADLTDPEWQDKFAKSLADGLNSYFTLNSN